MNKPSPAYEGTESYVFACYAHKDAECVYTDLILLKHNDINVWYDEGIPAGQSWRAGIAMAIRSANKFVFFISEASLKSMHCLRELDYAINKDIDIIPIYLDNSSLPEELELALNRVQALSRCKDSMYSEHLLGAMQEKTRLMPHLRVRRKRFLNIGLPILAIGFGFFL